MGRVTEAVGRFVLTGIAFLFVAFFVSTPYQSLLVLGAFVMFGLYLGAFAIAVHAALKGTPRVDRSFKLVVAMIPPWYVLAHVTMYGPEPGFGSLLAKYAFRTALTVLMLGFAYAVVYRWRLLDRDGPVGRRLGVA